MNPIKFVDRQLNGITMYRLMLYGLAAITGLALLYSVTGVLGMPLGWMLASLGVLMTVGFVVNQLLAIVLEVPPNFESSLITTFILFLIMPPATGVSDLALLALVEAVAIGSKYLLVWRGKHIFNPATLGAAIVTVTGLYPVTWWVGVPLLIPAVALLGLLEVRKIRRFSMLGAFFLASFVGLAALAISRGGSVSELIWLSLISGPLVFFGFIMVTEPSTMPGRRQNQIIFGGLVGILAVSQFNVGAVYMSALLALLIGNVYAFAVNSKSSVRMKLLAKNQLSARVYEFVFTPTRPLKFLPGQYMDWTLPTVIPDSRGNRRTFTIASSPTEPEVRLGIKLYEPRSSYKTALMKMEVGDALVGAHVAGDFILPADTSKKLVFIAGGIGVTPFRSMAKALIDSGKKRDIVMYYAVSDPKEVSFGKVLETAASNGLRLITVLNPRAKSADWKGEIGPLNIEMIKRLSPDFAERRFYISGPSAMVDGYRTELSKAGVARKDVVSDWFTGY